MDTDQLIAEVARETGVLLSKADPVLAAAALYVATFDKALAKLDRQMKLQVDRVTAASAQSVADAKKEAELLLSEGAAWADSRIRAAGEAAAATVLAGLQQEVQKIEGTKRKMIRIVWAMAAMGQSANRYVDGVASAAWRQPAGLKSAERTVLFVWSLLPPKPGYRAGRGTQMERAKSWWLTLSIP